MSASWQLRMFDRGVRRLIRRKTWGDEARLVRRARRLFGAPAPWAWATSVGLEVRPVEESGVSGEWVEPREKRRETIFYIHGGGYVSCSSRSHRPITTSLARISRRRVFSVDYRLAPEHRFPAALDDVIAAYRWLIGGGGVDASSLAIAGDSAGGGLALGLLVAARDLGLQLPSCAVLYSPWLDLMGSGGSAQSNDGRCSMFRTANLKDYASVYLEKHSAADPRASPLFARLAGLPPLMFQVGDSELLLDDSRRAHEIVVADGGQSTLEVWPHVFHCWQMMADMVPESRAALDGSVEFMERHVSQRPHLRASGAGGVPVPHANIPSDSTTQSIA